MNHKLRVLVRLDVDRTAAVVAVTGCLTEVNYPALLPIIRRAGALMNELAVTVDLTGAKHIDGNATMLLERALTAALPGEEAADGVSVTVSAASPICPASSVSQQVQVAA